MANSTRSRWSRSTAGEVELSRIAGLIKSRLSRPKAVAYRSFWHEQRSLFMAQLTQFKSGVAVVRMSDLDMQPRQIKGCLHKG
jgi:hypothetical protein